MTLTSTLLTNIRTDIKAYLETIFLYGAVGTDNTASDPSDTALGTEVERNAISSFDDSVADRITASLIIATTEANSNTIAEAGWFNASSSGTMWNRNTLTAINKTSDIQLYLDTTIIITVEEV